MRPSAGTTFPASRRTISPGARSRAGISWAWPLRRTWTLGTAIFLRAAMACSARYSWVRPRAALMTTMMRMTTVSDTSPTRAEMTAATMRMMTITSLSWSQSMAQMLLTPFSTSSLGPYWVRRWVASAVVSPCSTLLCKAAMASSWVWWCQCFIEIVECGMGIGVYGLWPMAYGFLLITNSAVTPAMMPMTAAVMSPKL